MLEFYSSKVLNSVKDNIFMQNFFTEYFFSYNSHPIALIRRRQI